MSLRWKREPGTPNPQMINQQMSGYQPLPNMNGYGSFMQAQANAQQMQGYVPGPTYDGYASSQYASDLMRGYNESNPYNSTAFDPRTASKAEIKAMQSKLGVKADGVWGKRSQAAYDAANAVAPSEEDILRSNMNNLGRGMGGDAGAGAVDLYGRQMQQREQVQQEIAKLQTRLNEINTRIAEIDKSLPAGAGNDKAWEIAAQRASIGDMSAYDSMVQRGATGAQSANAIDNALMDAEKLTWGLNAKDDEDRMAARNQIEVALRKAERDAAQTGTKLPDSYYRLKNALEADVGGNASSLVNMLKYKKEKGTLTDADREYVEEMMKGKENSKEYETLMSFWTGSKGSTTEAKAKAKAEDKRITDMAIELENMSPEAQNDYWNKLSHADKVKLLKKGKWDKGYFKRSK